MKNLTLVLISALGIVSSCGPDEAQQSFYLRTQLLATALKEQNSKIAKDNSRQAEELVRVFQRISGFQNYNSTTRKALRNIRFIEASTQSLLTDINGVSLVLNKKASGESHKPFEIKISEEDQLRINKLGKKVEKYCASLRAINTPAEALQLIPPRVAALDNSTALYKTYFKEVSLLEALASLTQIESRVLAFEASALQEQALYIGCDGGVTTDAIGVLASAEANTVSAGSRYKATMMLSTTVRPVPLAMTVNGQAIPVNAYGQGAVSFIAEAAGPGQQRQVNKTWTGTIRTRWNGRDTVYQVRVPYTVVNRVK